MESATAAQERLRIREQELQDELNEVQRQPEQFETMVVASQWRHAPSGPKGRETVYPTATNRSCRLSNGPEQITLSSRRSEPWHCSGPESLPSARRSQQPDITS
ncbi:hypothetical protein [Streptomyces sp. DSM 118148]|uniref:hypothetical protein n=1 Tax=Streptomyces sp. DSM 118148 TaxID=3448667 RepID=UPI0040403D37